MTWYTTDDARRDAQKPGAAQVSLADVLRIAVEAGGWQPLGLPSNWDAGDYVFTKHELYAFAKLLLAERK